ncbi:hypothetical protein [uncultured Apibacter sp.]|uniref:hypothetical protein n=1 Tax=uncultured Apibacter sp. TaxID=1778616 RepID=UPI0025E88E84|nr:hypothetical protein [uncultured Apibacter sp.]
MNKVLKEVLLDKDYDYTKRWNDKIIQSTIKLRINDFNLEMVTDWRVFKRKINLWLTVEIYFLLRFVPLVISIKSIIGKSK